MSDRVLVATRKGLFTVGRTSSGWRIARSAFLADNVPMALADHRDGSLYAALAHGHFGPKMHRSTNGGETWDEIATPAYPEPPAGQDDRCPMRNIPIPWKTELIWSLEPGGADQPGRLWCGTVPGGLFRSDDHGQTWTLVRSLWDNPSRKKWFGGGLDFPGIHSICVHPQDSRHITVGVSCGGVWVSRDDGATWQCQADGMRAAYMPPEQAGEPDVQDPHRVVQCPADPKVLWSQHHNGVFRSTDGAALWHEIPDIQPSVFGFAVAVHPADGETAWLVPAIKDEKRIPVDGRVVVTRTRDGGKTFDVLRDGLPQAHAYDIVFRHALDVDATGDRLVMGSSTGSLWISENQGDSWEHVSAHLPQVYCARFVR